MVPGRELYSLQARDREPDTLFERLYENNVAGKITDERFARMSKKGEEEQAEIAEKMKSLKAAVDQSAGQAMTSDMFISTVRKYTRAKKLTPRMRNELIQYIEGHQAERVDGVWEQRLTIHYHCIGAINIPEARSLPLPEVTVNTRKGVCVSNTPSRQETASH